MAAIFNLQFSPLHLQLTYNILLIFLNEVNYKPSFPLCQSFFCKLPVPYHLAAVIHPAGQLCILCMILLQQYFTYFCQIFPDRNMLWAGFFTFPAFDTCIRMVQPMPSYQPFLLALCRFYITIKRQIIHCRQRARKPRYS